MTKKEAIRDLEKLMAFIVGWDHPDAIALAMAIEALKELPSADRPPKVVAQITFDEEKLREIVKEAVEGFKEEYEITDRPIGKWIDREYCQVDEDSYEVAICSKCGAEVTIEYPYDSYCPNCGTKMEV